MNRVVPSNFAIVDGDILSSNDCQYIAHQCNSVTTHAVGLAEQIFKNYPQSNVYSSEYQRNMGEIIVIDRVINMICQRYPGKAKYPNDSYKLRYSWFRCALAEISKINGLKSVSFPYNIGCGWAGGDWYNYYHLLIDFANDNPHIQVRIYKLI